MSDTPLFFFLRIGPHLDQEPQFASTSLFGIFKITVAFWHVWLSLPVMKFPMLYKLMLSLN